MWDKNTSFKANWPNNLKLSTLKTVIGYISDNLLIPILDFFYGLVPSYGLAIVALTIVIRLALFPLSAGSIRSARRMKIAQPVMQKRQAEIKSRYASDPKKQQEELGKLMGEFGSPLAGCLPLIVQMPILFALFDFKRITFCRCTLSCQYKSSSIRPNSRCRAQTIQDCKTLHIYNWKKSFPCYRSSSGWYKNRFRWFS